MLSGTVEEFEKLIREGEKDETGKVTITLPSPQGPVDNAYIDERLVVRPNGTAECQLTWQTFTKENWMQAFDVLSQRPDITKLVLEHARLDREAMRKLAENPHITDLYNNGFTGSDEIIELVSMPSLQVLSLYSYVERPIISSATIAAFANSELLYLELRGINFEFSGLKKLLEQSETLATLSLEYINFTEEEYNVLFSQSNKVTSLCITPTAPIPTNSLKILAENKTLEDIKLSDSHLSTEGWQILNSNTHINCFILTRMEINDEQFNIIRENPTLTHLILVGNPISSSMFSSDNIADISPYLQYMSVTTNEDIIEDVGGKPTCVGGTSSTKDWSR